jgi:hypothetical protein
MGDIANKSRGVQNVDNDGFLLGGSADKPLFVDTGGVGSSTIGDGRKVIATAGSAEALSTDTDVKEVTITAELDNTDVVVIGSSTVVAALLTRRGTPLFPGDSVSIETDNLNELFVDVMVNGEGITYQYTA